MTEGEASSGLCYTIGHPERCLMICSHIGRPARWDRYASISLGVAQGERWYSKGLTGFALDISTSTALVTSIVSMIIELHARLSVTSPFAPVAYRSDPVDYPRSKGNKNIALSRALTKKSEHCVDGRFDVLLTHRIIQLVTALLQQTSAIRITWLAHLIFDDLAHVTGP